MQWAAHTPGMPFAIKPVRNPDRLWVSTHGGGVWQSADGGKSWKLSGRELSDRVVSFVMLQPKSNTLWAGVEDGALARSKDGGQTWQWVMDDLAQTPHPVAFDPGNPKAIWIPDVNRHKRSVDGGAKWTEFRVSGGDVMTFAIHPKDSKIIFAGGMTTNPDNTHTVSDAVDIFDAASGQWTTARLSDARERSGATTVGNYAIFAGGDKGFVTYSPPLQGHQLGKGCARGCAPYALT